MKKLFWWKSALAFAGVSGLTIGSASGDIVYSFTNQTWNGFSFLPVLAPGQFASGTLTAVSVNATLNSSVSFTYADDLTVYIDPLPLSTGGLLQVGGFSSLSAAQRAFWFNGGSSAPGTVVNDTRSATPGPAGSWTTPLVFTGTVADPQIWIGNGYGAQGTSGNWTGSVTLRGISIVPEPSSAALVLTGAALVGSGLRRRRSPSTVS